jgi:ATP-dependent Lon protease
MNAKTKAVVLQKAEGLLSGDPFNSEKPKLNKWIDTVLRIPFGVFKPPPVSRESPVGEIREYIRSTEAALHKNVYGHAEAKAQIIQTLAKWISNPTSKGNVLGIHGPPGVGKSTLVKHIGDALGTPTITIPLGGASDGSFLDGHSYVYEGSLPGIMVSSVSKTGCMNPVILLDELDKVSTSPKGAEIVNILIHLTDPVQNTSFRDKYLGDVELDLSQAVFVFTFNDIEAVHPILKDRMLCIETKAYTFEEKLEIARRHLLPRICVEHGFGPSQFDVGEEALREIVSRIEGESGVRNMNRALEAIVSQVNFDRILGNFDAVPRIDIGGDMIRDNIKPKPANASVDHLYL